MSATEVPRKPGRPRSKKADPAIRMAAVELLAADGLRVLSMEAVAQRAGVGKATVYRC
jgi:AcrR family transcriptional regulator